MPEIQFRVHNCSSIKVLRNLKSSLGSRWVCSVAGALGSALVDWNFPLNLCLLHGIPLKGKIVGLEVSF